MRFGLRREAQRHAALPKLLAVPERCRAALATAVQNLRRTRRSWEIALPRVRRSAEWLNGGAEPLRETTSAARVYAAPELLSALRFGNGSAGASLMQEFGRQPSSFLAHYFRPCCRLC